MHETKNKQSENIATQKPAIIHKITSGKQASALGAYIAAVGLALLLYAVRNLIWRGPSSSTHDAVFLGAAELILLLATGTVALLLLTQSIQSWAGKASPSPSVPGEDPRIESSPPHANTYPARIRSILKTQRRELVTCALFAICAFCFMRAGLEFTRIHQAQSRPSSTYTIAVPLSVQSTDEEASRETQGTKPGESATTASRVPGFTSITWNVDALEIEGEDGLTKMVLSATLIILFGAVYPFVTGLASDHVGSIWEKLVVPGISAVMFAAGATEQAEAQSVKTDMQMIRHVFPPLTSLDRGERRVEVHNVLDIPDTSRRELDRALSVLQADMRMQIESMQNSSVKDRENLSNLRVTVSTLQNALTELSKDRSGSTKALAAAMTSALNENTQRLADLARHYDDKTASSDAKAEELAAGINQNISKEQAALTCALRHAFELDSQEAREAHISSDTQTARNERHLPARLIYFLIGEPKRKNSEETTLERHDHSLSHAPCEPTMQAALVRK